MTPDHPPMRLMLEHSVAAADLLMSIAVRLNIYQTAALNIAQCELKDWLARSREAKADEGMRRGLPPLEKPPLGEVRHVITIREVADHDV